TRPTPDGDRLGTAWRAEIPRALTALAQAWTDPAAWEGMTQVGGATLPGEIAGQIALDEVVLHAWDLARGTSHPHQQDPDTLEACLAAMTGIFPPDDLDARKGIFEPPVPVPDNAPLVDRVVAYSGRDPGWPARESGWGGRAGMPVAGTKFHFLQRLHENGLRTDPERGRGHTVVVSYDPTIYQGAAAHYR